MNRASGKGRLPRFVRISESVGAGRCTSENTVNVGLRRLGFDKDAHSAHGFRSSPRTLSVERLNEAPDVVEAQLAHMKSGPLGSAYDRAEFLQQRRGMTQRWADYCEALRDRSKRSNWTVESNSLDEREEKLPLAGVRLYLSVRNRIEDERARVVGSQPRPTPVSPILITLSIIAILLGVLYLRSSRRRSREEKGQGPATPDKPDTTLGEFRDMREALRPLEHKRSASRRDPQGRR